MLGTGCRQGLDAGTIGGMDAAEQLVQGAQHLRSEPCRNFSLRVAAGLEERRQTAVRRIIVQPKGGKDQFEAAEHGPATDVAERTERKLQPAAGLAARGLYEPQFAIGQQQAGRHSGFAQQPLQLLVWRRLPAFERAAPLGLDTWRLNPDEDLPTLFRIGHSPMRRQLRVALLHRDGQVRREGQGTGGARYLR